jgi:hypothetical protein
LPDLSAIANDDANSRRYFTASFDTNLCFVTTFRMLIYIIRNPVVNVGVIQSKSARQLYNFQNAKNI